MGVSSDLQSDAKKQKTRISTELEAGFCTFRDDPKRNFGGIGAIDKWPVTLLNKGFSYIYFYKYRQIYRQL